MGGVLGKGEPDRGWQAALGRPGCERAAGLTAWTSGRRGPGKSQPLLETTSESPRHVERKPRLGSAGQWRCHGRSVTSCDEDTGEAPVRGDSQR